MRRKFQKGIVLALVSGAIPGVAFAASPAPASAPLTRGAFASELVAATNGGSGNLSPAQAAQSLASQGIMKGYPDGSLHLSQPVTSYEAAVMVARALGYPGEVAPSGSTSGSGWGANRVAWLEHEGLIQGGSLGGMETATSAQQLLNQAFGSSQQALTLLQSAQHIASPLPEQMSGTVSANIQVTPPAGVSLPPGAPSTMVANVDATLTGRINSQGDFRVSITEVMSAPGMPGAPTGGMTFQLSEYLVNHVLYVEATLPAQMVPPGQSATTWAQMAMPSTTLMASQILPIDAAFLKAGHLRVVATGTSTSTLAFSMALTDPQSVLALLPGGSSMPSQMQGILGGMFQVLKAVYVHGQQTINTSEHIGTNMTLSAEIVSHHKLPANMPAVSGSFTEQVTAMPTADAPINLPSAAAQAVQAPTPPFLSGGSSSSSSGG